ncbi:MULTISPECIES: MraY family glycosyltransferase [unclassified Lentimonas]|uniref:MraY family glycosyltransferase n=1 Tax=unclassified Lentimonas TaxID=2630993 RepID=UPI001327E164|nr:MULTISPECIES: MraY family glycosyltransferase [unclassified Lentimonas]CAA6680052.1 Undecaprenyl-phosphate N-acetylglucosaminyl 1-phosphate transferase (EC [Lentimonas sp. CC4]CAA6685172.1 Undecaprenyl-phosphate N-acetylglucosaminyl 1-phosphate transferase (EC [Lentimonas sp. CC6]CAA7075102.1 Undecaprenyl-phosphate N-acetylglucosaminyl 1-phosphate transferase (EC [Lentimonas sp. CC4]CAA7168438.1 Undecaprenyl-phosphate N-acetylglucosaminyl 1-phosphate transferase (EC [Lentimonas sp. CC21]CAA
MLFPLLFFILLGCFASWLVIHCLLAVGFGQGGDGEVQHHHTHTGVIPRIGGVGLMAGFGLTYLLCFYQLNPDDNKTILHFAVAGGAFGAFLLGFIDDFRPLGAKVKLLAQILIGVAAYKCGLSIDRVGIPFTDTMVNLGVFGMFLTVGWFVAIMNLINLIDGLDGLAGGVGLMLMALLVYLSIQRGIAFSSILSLGMIGAILGFLFHNFPPAKCYMGDSGAYMIGYVIAALSLLNAEKGAVLAALIAPALALALPIVDVAFALLRRAIKGLPLFRPDRGHIHHRLMRTGLSRRNTVLVLYVVSLFALVGGLLAFADRGRYLPIFLGFAFVVILFALRGQKISAASVRVLLTDSLQSRQDTRNALYLKNWLVVEAERADSATHLWSDFRFVLKKMGFCRAELKLGEETRDFYVPHTPHDDLELLWKETHRTAGEIPMELTLYAEKDNFSEHQFTLATDIAAEALGSARTKWKDINGSPMDFDSVAKEATDYRKQKARNLYRPTY